MMIQLRQSEIETAIKDYLSNAGIRITGKSVQISFTASRTQAGLIADIDLNGITDPAPWDSDPVIQASEADAQCYTITEEPEPTSEVNPVNGKSLFG